MRQWIGVLAGVVLTGLAAAEDAVPTESVLFWTPEQQRSGYPAIHELLPTRPVRRGAEVLPLPAGAAPLREGLARLSWRHDGVTRALADYPEEDMVAGIVVVHRGQLLYEDYAHWHGPEDPWIAFSVAKSVSALLIGAAIHDGYIASVDEPVTAYLPRLRGSAYDGASIRDILTMSSGVAWNEDYTDPGSDVARAGAANGRTLLAYLAGRERSHPPGTVFNYNTGETNLVGEVLRAAIGNNASTYLEHKVWAPFGMERDATWLLEGPGLGETGGCCLNATLRDWARLGLFVLADGVLPDGTRVLPEGWVAASTAPSAAWDGYGYLWWLLGDGSFLADGIFGQMIYIDPALDLVIAQHGLWPEATSTEREARRLAMVNAVREAVRRQ